MVISPFIPAPVYFDIDLWVSGFPKSKKYLALIHEERRAAIFERVAKKSNEPPYLTKLQRREGSGYREIGEVNEDNIYVLPGFLQMYVRNAWEKWQTT